MNVDILSWMNRSWMASGDFSHVLIKNSLKASRSQADSTLQEGINKIHIT